MTWFHTYKIQHKFFDGHNVRTVVNLTDSHYFTYAWKTHFANSSTRIEYSLNPSNSVRAEDKRDFAYKTEKFPQIWSVAVMLNLFRRFTTNYLNFADSHLTHYKKEYNWDSETVDGHSGFTYFAMNDYRLFTVIFRFLVHIYASTFG